MLRPDPGEALLTSVCCFPSWGLGFHICSMGVTQPTSHGRCEGSVGEPLAQCPACGKEFLPADHCSYQL